MGTNGFEVIYFEFFCTELYWLVGTSTPVQIYVALEIESKTIAASFTTHSCQLFLY